MTDEENKLIKDRRRKLSLLREQGQAYPNGFRRDALAADLHARFEHADNESLESEAHSVTIAGRIMAKRVMGKASF
ncbi:MAG: lysine--tRNA ligase, partial [Pseudomonadota bacterium]